MAFKQKLEPFLSIAKALKMNQKEYKKITSQNNLLPRNIIEQTKNLISDKDKALVNKLKKILTSDPVEKPSKHSSGTETDYFVVDLTSDEISTIVEACGDAEVGSLDKDYNTTPQASYYGTLLDIWQAIEK